MTVKSGSGIWQVYFITAKNQPTANTNKLTKREDSEQDFCTQICLGTIPSKKKHSGQASFMLRTQVNVTMVGHLHRSF